MFKTQLYKKILLGLLFIVLLLPLWQSRFHYFDVPLLKGAVVSPQEADLSYEKWCTGEYQELKEKYINEMFGFRNLFVRLNNQIAYSVFKKPNANGVIIGKENYLYEESYLNAYTGQDFLGEDSTTHTINRLKFISDTLNKLGKQLIIVFAAGKASFYPEFIPDTYKQINEKTNYKILSSKAIKANLNVIDFNSWFMKNKSISKYPLYPQHGVHWSTYGTALAADSLIKKIEQLRNISMPHLQFDGVNLEEAHDVDYDIADGMNLLFHLKGFDVAYPKMLAIDSSNKTKPKVLVISDSFYWGMYNLGIANCFKNDHFWYYNKEVYPDNNTKETLAENQDFKTVIENHDVIVIMATEATLRKISWGFIERAERFFTGKTQQIIIDKKQNPEFKVKFKQMLQVIKGNAQWMIDVKKRALEKNITIDSMLIYEATWQVENLKE